MSISTELLTTARGSSWRKWDLHVHTPFSIYQSFGENDDLTWEAYLKDLEGLPAEFAVIGVNDYLFLDGYARLKTEQTENGRLKNLTLFPVVEFRIEKFAGIDFGKLKRINLHVIFSNELKPETIQSQFLNTLEQSYFLETGEQWTRAITRQSVEELGQQIKASIPVDQLSKYGSDITEGFNNLNVKEEAIVKALQKDCFKGKHLIAVGKTEWADLKWSDASIATKKSIINMAHVVFTAAAGVDDFARARGQLKSQGVNHLLLDCSDAHSLSTSTNKDKIGHCFTWIKADTTFEGLKQILYEPEHRVSVGLQKPREPLRKIESIKFDFPPSTLIKRNTSVDTQPFCLNDLKTELYFSPYFTCLIGGRGTGKSTIINLLGEKLGEKTEFFKDNNLVIDGKKYDIEGDPTGLISVTGTNEIEFISQGKVERLAEGDELTKLIFNERIKDSNSGFYSLDKEIAGRIEIIEENIRILFDADKLTASLKEKNKERLTAQNIVESVNDTRYKEITLKIGELQGELTSINNSNIAYNKLLNSIRILVNEHDGRRQGNEIDIRINAVLAMLKGIDEIREADGSITVSAKLFEVVNARIASITHDLSVENQKLKAFFAEKGTSEETIKDSQKANETLSRLITEISEIEAQIQKLKDLFKENNSKIEDLAALKESYAGLIQESLTSINSKLVGSNENVLNINFAFEFNREQFMQVLFDEFYATFNKYHISGTSMSRVKEVLFLIEPTEEIFNFDHKTFFSRFESEIELKGFPKTNNYVKMVIDILSTPINYAIYRMLIKKNLFNLSKFVKVRGFYGNKELQNCSFGQRCTAVIVTMLMTGVKPLVIDEPEAHLDNRLVADYLVELIKTKKLDRQVIFATHNSNFVINGDAELIHILDIPMNSLFTVATSTTIENTAHRETLLRLEGGRDAFLNRENKYGIR